MTSAPATVEIGRARIDAHAAWVILVCTSFACSGMVDAHWPAEVAASAALFTVRCTAPLTRSTCAVALSAMLSTVRCAVCAALSTRALVAGLDVGILLVLGETSPPIVLDWSMMCPIEKVTQKRNGEDASRVRTRTVGVIRSARDRTSSVLFVGR
jgi:hypothetical protein